MAQRSPRMIESFMVATNAAVGHLLGAAGARFRGVATPRPTGPKWRG